MICQVSVGRAADLKFLSFGWRSRMRCRSGTLDHIDEICTIVLHSAQSINKKHYKIIAVYRTNLEEDSGNNTRLYHLMVMFLNFCPNII
jgi:hypothetical protein